MSSGRAGVALLLAAALASLGIARCERGRVLVQEPTDRAGHLEPHTPGSGAPEEAALAEPIRQLRGEDVDLNRVAYTRTAIEGASPRIVLILIPGFLAGASTFDPIARDLVRAMDGSLEVWAVDRRSNALEDRRGARHALEGARAAGDPAAVQEALAEGARFYFPESDLDRDGVQDGPFPLPDAVPADGPSDFQRLAQDDVRFMAHWGVDTYVRDWRKLVLAARERVGPDGLVLFGGHSMGTTWTGVFAAYDFDPGPGVEAGHSLVDGLLLLEGGGPSAPSAGAPDAATYRAAVEDLEEGTSEVLADPDPSTDACEGALPCTSDLFLTDLFGFVDAVNLGPAGELNGVAADFAPAEPSLMQRTPLFGDFPVSLLLGAPMTNRSLVGFFLDDDFSTNAAFAASFGFSANGDNALNPFSAILSGDFLVANSNVETLRTWQAYDDPDLPRCPPAEPAPALGDPADPSTWTTGCALRDNGPRPGPGEAPRTWGAEREVTDLDAFARTLYETSNATEWYFVSGRPGIDLLFGRDSSALGAPELLNVTRNAQVDAPVLAIGGSNGLAPTEASFADYLGSIASTDLRVEIVPGYAHLDVLSAADNEAVPPILGWMSRLLRDERLAAAREEPTPESGS